MLLLLTAVYALRQVVAAPISTSDTWTFHDRSLLTCSDPGNCRTIWNITWSCLATVFACAWVAVHPNVLHGNQSPRWHSGLLHRARIMLYALIGPEFVIFWAWRQRCTASRKPRNARTLPDWSRVHGFFAAMGGFVSHDGTEILSLQDIECLVEDKMIEYPIVSEDEIKDRSKGDAVTKALAVFQTTWFLLQCAARTSQGLALTEIELATAAFAFLNFIAYALWWDKPLDVQCAIRVRRTDAWEEKTAADRSTLSSSTITMEQDRTYWHEAIKFLQCLANTLHEVMNRRTGDALDDCARAWGIRSVLGAVFTAMLFGGIHCIGWSYHFPSYAEQLLWRTSALAITTIPLGVVCMAFINRTYIDIPTCVIAVPLVFFVLSRSTLLVLSLTTMRSLPASALNTVEWTTFLPHI